MVGRRVVRGVEGHLRRRVIQPSAVGAFLHESGRSSARGASTAVDTMTMPSSACSTQDLRPCPSIMRSALCKPKLPLAPNGVAATTREAVCSTRSKGLIADHGFKPLTHRTIASRAEAHVALLNYHFGSKEQLIEEALARRASQLLALQHEALAALRARGDWNVEDVLWAYGRPFCVARPGGAVAVAQLPVPGRASCRPRPDRHDPDAAFRQRAPRMPGGAATRASRAPTMRRSRPDSAIAGCCSSTMRWRGARPAATAPTVVSEFRAADRVPGRRVAHACGGTERRRDAH